MTDRRCIFCGRLIDTDKQALFRMPPDHKHVPDEVYARYLESRGLGGRGISLPEVCGIGYQEMQKLSWENGRPVLITKTGRSSDVQICPSCHNEVFRNTDSESVRTAVFFGGKGSGRTSLILALANECITKQFSADGNYRYFFNEKIYDPDDIKDRAQSIGSGEGTADLREPVAIYRATGASGDGSVLCDVMHDVSGADTEDEQAINISMPFAVDAGHYVYCIAADRLAETLLTKDAREDMLVRLDMHRMMSACRYSESAPVLDIVVTKLDTAEKAGGIGADIAKISGDERSLKNYIFTAFPCIEEFEGVFSGLHAYAVSALPQPAEAEDGGLTAALYPRIFA